MDNVGCFEHTMPHSPKQYFSIESKECVYLIDFRGAKLLNIEEELG